MRAENAIQLPNTDILITVIITGEDDDDYNSVGEVAIYIGDQGDLSNGKLYSIKVNVSDKEAAISNEKSLTKNTEYSVSLVELEETGMMS